MSREGRIVEFLLCLAIGAVVSVCLVKMCICLLKPMTNKLEEIKEQQEQQAELLDILGEDEYELLIG